MRAILPGRPQSKRQALSTAHWDGLRLVAYISGNAVIVATGPRTILQTIYVDTVESLTAIAIDESSGRIALCDESHVYVYDAIGRDEDLLRWVQAYDLTKDEDAHIVTSLSWSSAEELLIGGSRLLLWYLPDSSRPRVVWEQSIAYPTALALLSHDGALIATCGQHDRLVKIWRRLSYEVDSTRFDVSYLPQPAAVTGLHWRKPWHVEQNLDSLLYTFCADNHVRVWAYSDLHSLTVMQPIADLDMNASIQPRRLSVGSVSRRRYAFIIDSRDFSSATEKAVQTAPAQGIDHALEHLIEIANRSPEICIVLDGIGHMSAWGLENAGCKNKNPTVVFNIAVVDGMNIQLPKQDDPLEDYIHFCVFAGGSMKSSLSLLVHSYVGSISWYDSQITHLFDTSPREHRARLLTSWTGHDGLVERIVRDQSGRCVCSWTEDGSLIVWRHGTNQSAAPLLLKSSYDGEEEILDAIFLKDMNFLVILEQSKICVLNLSTSHASLLVAASTTRGKDPVSLMQTDHSRNGSSAMFFGVIYRDRSIETWQANLSDAGSGVNHGNGVKSSIRNIGDIKLTLGDTKLVIFSSTHIHTSASEPGSFTGSTYSACSLTMNGELRGLRSSYDESQKKHKLIPTATISTNLGKPAFASAVSSGKVVIVDSSKTSLTIWDLLKGACEFQVDFEISDTIEHLAWTSTRHGHLMLAVCFAFNIVVLGQTRFPCSVDGEAWTTLQHIRMRDFTPHAIGDLCLLDDGDILVGAGNQLYVLDSVVERGTGHQLQDLSNKLDVNLTTDFIAILNTTLPVMHPDFLHLLAALGKCDLLMRVIVSLHHKLKYFSEGDLLPSTLDFEMEQLSRLISVENGDLRRDAKSKLNLANGDSHGVEDLVTENVVARLRENLEKYDLPIMSAQEQTRLAKIVNIAKELELHQKSLDENGLRYVHALYTHRQADLPWSAILFASMSTSHEVLVDLVTRYYGGKLTWEGARKSGLFLWLSDPEALRTQMENVARAEYTKHEDRNPVDCSLYYFALGKKNVLQGLWRMTVGVREKENTMKLLANNFNDPKWKATALKNAYALISKRRFEYAAAFFLLGGSLKDAVNVCAHQMKDLQLAIAIAKVYEQDNGIVLRDLIEQTILPAATDSDQGRWMASWAYTVLAQPEQAIQVIVRPVHMVVGTPLSSITGVPRSFRFRANDPVLSVLYIQLRSQLVKKSEWRGVVTPREEWDFVMRCVRHYVRMGCDVLALALVRSWEFVSESTAGEQSKSLAVAQPQDAVAEREPEEKQGLEKERKRKKPPPTQFQEPSSSSLLDSFGF